MSTRMPPFLLGAAILFWGWRCEIWYWTLIPAILVELPRFVSTRWEFSMTDLRRIFDLCILLVLAEVVVIYSTSERISSEMSLKFSQWLPVPLFPIMLAQVFGNHEKIPLSVFSIFLRLDPESTLAHKSYNISYGFFGICLMAAGAVPVDTPYFYPAIVLLISYALWWVRPRRITVSSAVLWVCCIGFISVAGFAGHSGLRYAQGNLEDLISNWVNLHWRRDTDPSQSLTSIGHVGKIRQSGRIVLRVTPESTDSPPALLAEASYSTYSNGNWRLLENRSRVTHTDTNDNIWLLPAKKVSREVRISKYLRNGTGLLPLPKGAYEIHNLPANLELSELGAAKLDNGPGLVDCTVLYGPGNSVYGPTNAADLTIPTNELPVIDAIAAELDLHNPSKPDIQKIQAIGRYFNDFSYSLHITPQAIDPERKKSPLGMFLTQTKTGHCEYYATASTLLLRRAGIPARYSVGYSINENSKSGATILVRERHAHAWTLVWRSDLQRWEDVDNTPPDLASFEKKEGSAWESVSDAWANLLFKFAQWRASKTSNLKQLGWLLIPLILFFIWRILFTRRRRKKKMDSTSGRTLVCHGLDSDYYRIERHLARMGMQRMPHELYDSWICRLSLPEPELLHHILELHRRLRFDPHGLNAAEREVLKLEVDRWLDSFVKQAQETILK